MSSKIIELPLAERLRGIDENIVVSVETVTPQVATDWLRANKHNRPVRRGHVNFLASEILKGNWQVNGQSIVISHDEQVLDGQHRLLAVIEAGQQIKSLVVYGIKPEAFKTMDTGAVRTSADALFLENPEIPQHIVKASATAVKWCKLMESGNLNKVLKVSNTEVLRYVESHRSIIECARILAGYPQDARPISISCGTALFEVFQRRSQDAAALFMERLFTGVEIGADDIEYVLRIALLKNAQRTLKLPTTAKMAMCIKAWNWRRRAMPHANQNVIAVKPDDPAQVKIL